MKPYELSYLIAPELSEPEIKGFQEKIVGWVQEKGILIDTRLAKKFTLAYPIKGRVSAFFATLNFQSKAEDIIGLENKIKAEPNVIRYLILTKFAPKVKARRSKPRIVKKIEEPKKEKAKLEEIEQKLEEVLGTTQ